MLKVNFGAIAACLLVNARGAVPDGSRGPGAPLRFVVYVHV